MRVTSAEFSPLPSHLYHFPRVPKSDRKIRERDLNSFPADSGMDAAAKMKEKGEAEVGKREGRDILTTVGKGYYRHHFMLRIFLKTKLYRPFCHFVAFSYKKLNHTIHSSIQRYRESSRRRTKSGFCTDASTKGRLLV